MTFGEKVAKKRALIKRHQDELRNILIDCPHEHMEYRSHYFSGSYNDVAYTRTWKECTVCGKRIDAVIEEHSWFG